MMDYIYFRSPDDKPDEPAAPEPPGWLEPPFLTTPSTVWKFCLRTVPIASVMSALPSLL